MDEIGSPASIFAKLSSIGLLVLANAFFVASEFALINVRRSRLETLASEGHRSAKLVLRSLDQLDQFISSVQIGVTIASLGLGWMGERTIGAFVTPAFTALLSSRLHPEAVSSVVTFATITFLSIVIGEVAPKTLAIDRAETIAFFVIRPMQLFSRALRPLVWFLTASGAMALRAVGVRGSPDRKVILSEAELRQLLSVSHHEGQIEAVEQQMIDNVFDFAGTAVEKVMTPRVDVCAIDSRASLWQLVGEFSKSGYSRLPVFRERFEEIIGVVLSKDVLPYTQHPERFEMQKVLHPPLFVPAVAKLDDVLRQMRHAHIHIAIVVDEHGAIEGIVTLEDLLEEIVGEIRDEHDVEPALPVHREPDGSFLLDGTLPVRDANRELGAGLPESEDYNTIAGFLMAKAGRILTRGDSVEHEGHLFTVQAVARHRIVRVRLQPRASTISARDHSSP